MKKIKQLRYITGIDENKSSESILIPKWKVERIETSHVKMYQNALKILPELSPATREVLDFVVHEMDRRNFISNDTSLKKNFQYLQKKHGRVQYTNGTINKSFSELLEKEILVKGKSYGRGTYRVNPIYFSKVSEQERIEQLRAMREAPYKDENNMVRHDLLKRT